MCHTNTLEALQQSNQIRTPDGIQLWIPLVRSDRNFDDLLLHVDVAFQL